jgi:hypothetical protein
MQGLFKALRKSRHARPLWPPAIMIAAARSGNNNLGHNIEITEQGERPSGHSITLSPDRQCKTRSECGGPSAESFE